MFCVLGDTQDLAEELTAVRQHIHAHPELGYEEHATGDLVAKLLTEWGFSVTRNVGQTGMVATLQNGTGSRAVALRADMDALPIIEETALKYASTVSGKMHACGHDGHTTMLLGAARELARSRRFSGTVHLIFQPAEEVGKHSGAQRMIEDGLFERFPCDAIFGMHNHPGLPTGHFGFHAGPFMCASDTAFITIKGQGGHAARPHQAVDPLVAASHVVVALQAVISRNIDPLQTGIISIGMFHSGHVENVIPDTARMGLSIRSFTPEIRQRLKERIIEVATQQAAVFGATAEIDYIEGYPVLVNSDEETAFASEVAEELVGADKVDTAFPAITGSEDFAYYLQRVPGCFMRLGNGTNSAMLHNPRYDFNDDNLTTGAAYWTRLVERFLSVNT